MDYNRIESKLLHNREINIKLIDERMLPLATKQEKYEKKFPGKLRKYSSVVKRLENRLPLYLMCQYTAFQLFRENGLGEKYLNHRKMKHITADERAHMEKILQHPWHYTFYRLKEEIEDSFYTMVNICTGEEFTLYSEGTAELLDNFGEDILFFTLLGFNGDVHETYSLICYFCGFSDRDILAFTKCIDSSVEEMSDIPAQISKDPIPYMMLFAFAQTPKVNTFQDQEILICSYEIENFLPPAKEELEKEFTVVENSGVLYCFDENWSEVPHFGALYIDMNKKRLLLDAGTKDAYDALKDRAKRIHIPIADEPNLSMSPAMVMAIGDILNKKRTKESYAHLFNSEYRPEDIASMKELNTCLEKMSSYININQKMPYENLSTEFGVDVEVIKNIEEKLRLLQKQ